MKIRPIIKSSAQQMEELSPTHMTEIPEGRNGSLNPLHFIGDLYHSHFLHTRIRENILPSLHKLDFLNFLSLLTCFKFWDTRIQSAEIDFY